VRDPGKAACFDLTVRCLYERADAITCARYNFEGL